MDPLTSPKKALDDAVKIAGVSDWRELAQAGWSGPLHHLIHDPLVRDMWVMHGHVFVRSTKAGETSAGIYLSDEWIKFLVSVWRNAYNYKERIEVEQNIISRSTLPFGGGKHGGVRYLYQPPAFSAYGSSLYVRRLPANPWPLSDLVRNNTLPQEAADMLLSFLKVGTPMIVSGQTGAGKTTMLGALVRELQELMYPLNLLVIERSHELPIEKPCYRWEQDPRGEISLDHLAEKATQLGLEWLVIGEITGGEAFFAAKAFAQGIPVMTTLHADSSTASFTRLGMLAIEYTKDPALLPMIMQDLSTQGMIAVHLAIKEREEGFLGAVTGIDELIGAAGTHPVVNPLWQWNEGDDNTPPGLRFNYGSVSQLSAGTKTRFKSKGIDFPIPPAPAEKEIRRKGRR